MNAITKMCNNVIFAMKRNAPAILLWVGIGTGAACVGKACYDTAKKTVPLLAKAKNDISEVKASVSGEESVNEGFLAEAKKKQMDICLRTAGKLGLIYMPSAALGLVSVASLITSHNIARKRILGLSAAYAALDGTFNTYRNGVIDKYGETEDYELFNGIKTETIEKDVTDDEDNTYTVTEEKKVATVNPETNIYTRFFDRGNPDWDDDPDIRRLFLEAKERTANMMLENRGYLLLNDVYKLLGYPATRAGYSVGWLRNDDENPNHHGYVSFGWKDISDSYSRALLNGYEECVILNFNVEGPILDKAVKHRLLGA